MTAIQLTRRSHPHFPVPRKMAATSAVSGRALGAVRWMWIPHQVPYLLGLALQEKVVARRLQAKQYLEGLPSASPASRQQAGHDAKASEVSSSIREAERVARQDYLFLLEHTPVYTEGRRKGAKEAIADDAEGKRLQALGADYIVAQRGGLITFHGPGQIVGYPIWDISRMNNLSTRCYVDKMQTVFRDLLQHHYGISTVPPPDDHTGVWADVSHKILSIGIQVRQRITSHGFALNVSAQPLLTWFSHIVACGIEGKRMTSIERELALRVCKEEATRPDLEASVKSEKRVEGAANADKLTEIEPGLLLGPESRLTVDQVAPLVAAQFGQTYERQMQAVNDDELRFQADSTTNVLQRVWFAGEEVKPLTTL